MLWNSSIKKYRKDMKSLRDRLFNDKPKIPAASSQEKAVCSEDIPF